MREITSRDGVYYQSSGTVDLTRRDSRTLNTGNGVFIELAEFTFTAYNTGLAPTYRNFAVV
jgi:hypothetical protein